MSNDIASVGVRTIPLADPSREYTESPLYEQLMTTGHAPEAGHIRAQCINQSVEYGDLDLLFQHKNGLLDGWLLARCQLFPDTVEVYRQYALTFLNQCA